MALIELPFPPASLSGHNKGHYHAKSPIVAKYREWAKAAALEVCSQVSISDAGDIPISVTFYPPDNRGDRVNFPVRMKPVWDGIADGLGVNDKRFLPSYHFALPCKPGCVVVSIGVGDA